MLTERLGGLGFPLDDKERSVSAVAGELRIVRNRWAHIDDFDALDLWRTVDFAQRFMENLGAPSGRLQDLARQALDALAAERTAPPAHEAEMTHTVSPRSASVAATDPTAEVEAVPAPDTAVRVATPAPLAARSIASASDPGCYEPWVVVAREAGVIEDLPRKAAKQKVCAVAAEITDMEGPVHIDRVATLVARTYGVVRLAEKRRAPIVRQICASGFHVDGDGFAWPEDFDPATLTGYRPTSAGEDRDLTQVSPVEFRNAAASVALELTGEARMRAVMTVFGRSRLTAGYRKHLTKVLGD